MNWEIFSELLMVIALALNIIAMMLMRKANKERFSVRDSESSSCLKSHSFTCDMSFPWNFFCRNIRRTSVAPLDSSSGSNLSRSGAGSIESPNVLLTGAP